MPKVAALFVETNGCYFGLPNVDPWDEPRDARLYALQAKTYAALGKRTAQHQAQAEVYVLQGSLPAAIEQLQIARSAGDGDFYQLSVIDARLKELRAQHAQEMKDAKR